MASYSQEFKDQIVRKLMPPTVMSVAALSRETGIRDYIHVCDLAEGHVAAIDYLEREGGMLTVNLGAGQGYSVLDVIKAFEKVRSSPNAGEKVMATLVDSARNA